MKWLHLEPLVLITRVSSMQYHFLFCIVHLFCSYFLKNFTSIIINTEKKFLQRKKWKKWASFAKNILKNYDSFWIYKASNLVSPLLIVQAIFQSRQVYFLQLSHGFKYYGQKHSNLLNFLPGGNGRYAKIFSHKEFTICGKLVLQN